ncbi:MAG: hypothetical protein COA68_17745 [Oceanobacter sp.]|nr:MAG: hypothetical protein COA68_17745 [Oceanobacter sp.]
MKTPMLTNCVCSAAITALLVITLMAHLCSASLTVTSTLASLSASHSVTPSLTPTNATAPPTAPPPPPCTGLQTITGLIASDTTYTARDGCDVSITSATISANVVITVVLADPNSSVTVDSSSFSAGAFLRVNSALTAAATSCVVSVTSNSFDEATLVLRGSFLGCVVSIASNDHSQRAAHGLAQVDCGEAIVGFLFDGTTTDSLSITDNTLRSPNTGSSVAVAVLFAASSISKSFAMLRNTITVNSNASYGVLFTKTAIALVDGGDFGMQHNTMTTAGTVTANCITFRASPIAIGTGSAMNLLINTLTATATAGTAAGASFGAITITSSGTFSFPIPSSNTVTTTGSVSSTTAEYNSTTPICVLTPATASLSASHTITNSLTASRSRTTTSQPAPTSNLSNCVLQGGAYFDAASFAECPTVVPCVVTMCGCIGGNYTGAGRCKLPTSPTAVRALSCLPAAYSCIVQAALALYVPGADAANPTLDACVAWSVGIARDHALYAAAPTKTSTQLVQSCNRSVCEALHAVGSNIALGALCSFPGVTAVAAYVAPGRCPFVCPDGTCAGYLANCTCVANAQLYNISTSFERSLAAGFDVTNDLNGLAYGTYAVPSGNCSTYDFGPFMRFAWTLRNATSTVLAMHGATLRVPKLTMRPSTTYTLTVTVAGLLDSVHVTVSHTITAEAPAPTVTIAQGGGSLRVPNTRAVTLPTVVNDPFAPAAPVASWACSIIAGAVSCPDMTNATVARLVIPAGAAAGSFMITFTYRGVASSSVNVTIVAGQIPLVRILQASAPVVAVPAVYLPTQRINLASSVTGFTGNVTTAWTVNGVSTSTATTLSISASALNASTAEQLAAGAAVENIITVRVTASADAGVFGEASLSVVVTPTYAVTLAVHKLGDGAATEATGLRDTLLLTAASAIAHAGAPYGLAFQYAFLFFADDQRRALNAVPSGTGYAVQAPMPFGAPAEASAVSVIFQAQLLLGGSVVSSANQTFSVVQPPANAAADDQIQQAAAIADPAAAVAVATNIKTLMASSGNTTKVKEMALAVVNMLAKAVTDFGSQSSEQQAVIFEALSASAEAVSTDPTQKKVLQAKTLALMTAALSSPSFSAANGGTALAALASLDAKDSKAGVATLAAKLASDATVPVGEVRTFSAPGVTIATVRQSASDLGGLSVGDGSSALTVAAGFALPGVPDNTFVSVASAAFAENPFDSDAGKRPEGSVVSFEIGVDGATVVVADLATPLSIGLSGATGTAVCKYWDADSAAWSTAGVVTAVVDGVVTCQTTHLTAFASFSTSSAAGVALSALVAVLLIAAQLLA